MTEERVGVLELLPGMLFSPFQTLKRASARRSFRSAFLLYLLVILINGLSEFLTLRTSPAAELPASIGLVIFFLVAVPVALILWFLQAGFFYLAGHLMGGRGVPLGILSVCALVVTPQLFLVPLNVLLVLAKVAEPVVTGVGLVAGLAVAIWMLVLLVVGLREEHELATGQAVLLVLIPILAIILLVFLFAAMVGIIAATGLGGFVKP
ncbi:Protein of unknown function DUF2143 [Ammonifex degensii KC4]|uniref:Yip1 domain-containing protein n=1 Tax=Ammonifex degensii (strain DSM 10501 / KC4) TaxID=429009 RepID=C9RAC0_AMMDK|nr:YIP1 family protein [Ammonifex degensii]ACX51229.1 Protein of unknown function DUF2143 [Ammonifex degensii KC4]